MSVDESRSHRLASFAQTNTSINMSKPAKSQQTNKKTRSTSSTTAVSGKSKSKKVSKGVKLRDRANLDSMNSLDSVGELQSRLGSNGRAQPVKKPARTVRCSVSSGNEIC